MNIIISKKYQINVPIDYLYKAYNYYRNYCLKNNIDNEIVDCLDYMELEEIPVDKVDLILDFYYENF
tara:strand:- start:14343 stop:14543 length:201 start_codon:yes stop_codon:yes gene_type:complete